jgi:hypothetical protein
MPIPINNRHLRQFITWRYLLWKLVVINWCVIMEQVSGGSVDIFADCGTSPVASDERGMSKDRFNPKPGLQTGTYANIRCILSFTDNFKPNSAPKHDKLLFLKSHASCIFQCLMKNSTLAFFVVVQTCRNDGTGKIIFSRIKKCTVWNFSGPRNTQCCTQWPTESREETHTGLAVPSGPTFVATLKFSWRSLLDPFFVYVFV